MLDRKRSFLNVFVSIAFKIILLILQILSRRYLISCIGNDVNGVNSLFNSILGVLEIAELGVGSAITFSMYAPIINGDFDTVSSLYVLFKRVYYIVGGIILVAGLIIMLFLPVLAKGLDTTRVNLYSTFAIMLVSVVLGYAYSAKTSLINAFKNNYITTTFSSVSIIIRNCCEIAFAIIFKSFAMYLVARIIGTVLQWLFTEIYVRKKYKKVILHFAPLRKEVSQEVRKNIKAMFMHKIGGVLVNSADSIIISAFIGVTILGFYNNYTTIAIAMNGILVLFFTPLTSVLGHLCVSHNIEEEKKYFTFFYLFNFIIGIVFFLGFYAIIDDLIMIMWPDSQTMMWAVPLIVTINYFIQFLRQTVLVFRDATGTFYYDRWKPLVEGLFNIVLSIAFVYVFKGQEFGVVGVIVATIITNIFICHIVEPYVLYKHAFNQSPKKYYLLNYFCIAVFVGLVFLFDVVRITNPDLNIWLRILANGSMAVGIALIPTIFVFIISKNFRREFIGIFSGLYKKLTNR